MKNTLYEGGHMRKRLSWLLLIAVALSMAACATYQAQLQPAGERSGFQEKIHDQQKRINQGIKSGELTQREAQVLQANLDNIRIRYKNMRSDGAMRQKEIAKLEEMLDRNSRMIHNKKHNPVERMD